MDPIRQLTTPVAEVRLQSTREIDEYGEEWIVIDGIETKVPSRQHAEKIMHQQDATRVQIRADLDAIGVRDRVEEVEMTDEDGNKYTVSLLPPGDSGANHLQIGKFPDAEGLFENAEIEQSKADAEVEKARREFEATVVHLQVYLNRPWYIKARDKIASIFRKEK